MPVRFGQQGEKRLARVSRTRGDSEWREEQWKCLALDSEHQDTNQTYVNEGIGLLELAQKAGGLFRQQSAAEKPKLLDFVLSNCTWMDGILTADYRQSLDLLAKNDITPETKKPAEQARTGISGNWLPIVDAYRTLCIAPAPEARAVFQAVRAYRPEHASVWTSASIAWKTVFFNTRESNETLTVNVTEAL